MSTLTLDFTDSSFDDGLNNDGINDFVLSNNGGGLGVFKAGGPMGPDDAITVDENINVAAGISAMAITTNPGTEFTFEFLDTDNNDTRTKGDEYAAAAMKEGNEVFSLSINESFFSAGFDVTNGDTMQVNFTEKGYSIPGTPGTVTPKSVDIIPASVHEWPQSIGTLGHNGNNWVLDIGPDRTTGNWSTVSTAITAAGGNGIDGMVLSYWDGNLPYLLASMTTGGTPAINVADVNYSYFIGDGGGNGGETTWVLSGDLNGREATNTDDSIGFRAGQYDGVFKGGEGFDTLVFSHSLGGDGQLFIDLSSGIGMFGNNQSSPLVQFADIGEATYDLDWERLETEGHSNDFVIVGGGIGSAADNTGLTSSTSAIVDGFFEMSLGMGEDQVYVNDTSTGITLDLSGADNSYVSAFNDGEDVSMAGVHTYSGEDGVGEIYMTGQGDGGVVDYIYAGDNNDLSVYNGGEDGVVVDFGLNAAGEDGLDYGGNTYFGEDFFASYSDNDAIDLRGMDSVEILGEASHAAILVSETVGAGEDAVEMTAAIFGEDVESIFVTQSGDDGDTDVLVDMSHLYGEDAGILRQGVEDVSGGTYDVATSAHLDSFASETSPMQIFYDGDHNAFVDTNDHLTWTSSETVVAHDVVGEDGGVNEQQKGWADAVYQNDTGGAATPSFYVEIAGQKVAVYLDQTDKDDVAWKVDTSAFAITSDASIYTGDGEDVIATLEDAYGVSIDGEDLNEASNVYLNASESDIEDLLYAASGEDELGDVMSESAYDFGFYTQVKATKEGGGETFVNVALNYDEGSWSLSNDASTRVQMDYNTVSNGDGTAAIGGLGSDFVELGSQGVDDTNIAMGNGGGDTYKVGSGDEGIINELGDLQLRVGGMGSDSDAVQFELVNSIDELTFTRKRIAGEKEGSTLQIDAGDKGSATLFDQYNDFLSFRKTEYLVIDDGATRDEVFALVTDTDDGISGGMFPPMIPLMKGMARFEDSNSWDNEIYVAHADGAMTVDLGGTDYVFLGDDQANSVTVNIDQILMGEDSGSVTVSGIENDNLLIESTMVGGEDIVAAYDEIKANADSAHISWSENSDGDLVFNIDVDGVGGTDLLTDTITFEREDELNEGRILFEFG